jgi:hypothetical protein
MARLVAQRLLDKHPKSTPEELAAEARRKMATSSSAMNQAMADTVVRFLEATQTTTPRTRGRFPASALVLVVANLLPVYGVLAWDWAVLPLLLLYWAENVVVGLLAVARMLSIAPGDGFGWVAKTFLVPFFLVHFGLFTLAHGVFVLLFFNPDQRSGALADPGYWLGVLDDHSLWPALAMLGASHAFSFASNFIGRGEYRLASVRQQMIEPYQRLLPLHVAVIVGGVTIAALESPTWSLLVLVVLKIAVDVAAHLREPRPRRWVPRVLAAEG